MYPRRADRRQSRGKGDSAESREQACARGGASENIRRTVRFKKRESYRGENGFAASPVGCPGGSFFIADFDREDISYGSQRLSCSAYYPILG